LLYNQLKLQLRVTSEHTRSLSAQEMMDALNSAAAFSNPNYAISKLEILTRACFAIGLRDIKPKEMDVLCALACSMGQTSAAASVHNRRHQTNTASM
jgi:hypothetical protein